jgi:hypothetical protein
LTKLPIIHRPAPMPPEFATPDEQLRRRPRVLFWINALRVDPEAKPFDLDAEELAFVMRTVSGRRDRRFEAAYRGALRDISPHLAAPEITNWHRALPLVFGLPEMQQFWAAVQLDLPSRVPGQQRRGPKPTISTAKAAVCLLATGETGAFLEDAYWALEGSHDLREMFETLDRIAQERAEPSLPGLGAMPIGLQLSSYPTVDRQLPLLAEPIIAAARRTRIRLLHSLREMYPLIGRRLMIDGCDVPAWVPQRAARRGDAAAEAQLRAFAPDAGFRAYARRAGRKVPVTEAHSAPALLRNDIAKAWRGYYKVTITDVDSGGLPHVTLVFDAADDEAPALVGLLETLYREWRELDPFFAVDDIAGDSAWHEDWACELCLRQYGIHPIFRYYEQGGQRMVSEEYSRDGSVKALTAKGQLICSAHGNRLTHLGLEGVSRGELEPGQLQSGTLRVRAHCPDGCGRLGLSTQASPRHLLQHPHFDDGGTRQHLHAYRQARLDRLNLQESYHNRLKSGFKLGTEGPDRTRIRDLRVVTALMELADLFMVAAAVWDVRSQHRIPMHLAVPVTTRGVEPPARKARRAA